MAERCKEKDIPQWLTAYGFDLLDAERAAAVAGHLLTCPDCAEAFYRLTELKHTLTEHPPELLSRLDALREKKKDYRWISPGAVRGLSYAAVFLVALAGAWLYTHRPPPPFSGPSGVDVRGHRTRLEPRGNLSAAPRVFQWEGVANAHFYQIEIQNTQTGEVLIKTETPETRWTLPEAEFRRLQPGTVYRWIVTALDNSGSRITQAEGEFSIR